MIFFGNDTTLSSTAHKLELLIKAKLWFQVLLGMVMGVMVGGFLRTEWNPFSITQVEHIAEWVALPGVLFLKLISMVMVPLIIASILRGFGGRSDNERIKKIGLRLFLYILCTTLIAIGVGVILSNTIKPGAYVNQTMQENIELQSGESTFDQKSVSLFGLVSGLVPENPFSSILNVDMVGIVVFSIFVGIALANLPRKKSKPVLELLDAILSICMTIVKWAMFLAPLAVFGFMAQMIMRLGISTLISLAAYVFTVLLGLFCIYLTYIVIYVLFQKKSPVEFIKKIIPLQLLAFSTSSSAAVMPLSIKTAEEDLGVETGTAELVVPIGATMNMAGSALYQTTTLLLLVQLSGITLSFTQMMILIFSVVAASIGAPGTPALGVVILASIASQVGIPTAGLVMVLGVDRILDMFKTVINVTGDMTACVLLDQHVQENM
jgi:Na+/H+-dicarboxylate symporter